VDIIGHIVWLVGIFFSYKFWVCKIAKDTFNQTHSLILFFLSIYQYVFISSFFFNAFHSLVAQKQLYLTRAFKKLTTEGVSSSLTVIVWRKEITVDHKNHFWTSVSKHNQFTFNSLLTKINFFKLNSIKINSHYRQTKHT
jgi:hypothetical protein